MTGTTGFAPLLVLWVCTSFVLGLLVYHVEAEGGKQWIPRSRSNSGFGSFMGLVSNGISSFANGIKMRPLFPGRLFPSGFQHRETSGPWTKSKQYRRSLSVVDSRLDKLAVGEGSGGDFFQHDPSGASWGPDPLNLAPSPQQALSGSFVASGFGGQPTGAYAPVALPASPNPGSGIEPSPPGKVKKYSYVLIDSVKSKGSEAKPAGLQASTSGDEAVVPLFKTQDIPMNFQPELYYEDLRSISPLSKDGMDVSSSSSPLAFEDSGFSVGEAAPPSSPSSIEPPADQKVKTSVEPSQEDPTAFQDVQQPVLTLAATMTSSSTPRDAAAIGGGPEIREMFARLQQEQQPQQLDNADDFDDGEDDGKSEAVVYEYTVDSLEDLAAVVAQESLGGGSGPKVTPQPKAVASKTSGTTGSRREPTISIHRPDGRDSGAAAAPSTSTRLISNPDPVPEGLLRDDEVVDTRGRQALGVKDSAGDGKDQGTVGFPFPQLGQFKPFKIPEEFRMSLNQPPSWINLETW